MRSEAVRHGFVAKEDGAALVEAALVMPILLLIMFGLMELGLYFWNASLAGKAVQLGVRRAIVSDAVAVGPGLDPAESEGYWDGLPPGLRCFPAPRETGPCPSFSVECDTVRRCDCTGGGCRFTFAAERLSPILQAMQAVMPSLRAENLRIGYATNGLGYVGRPVPVPVDVTVSLIGVTYRPILLGDLMGSVLPLRASARLPGEDLRAR